MPALELKTNVSLADPATFVKEFSQIAADALGKPLAYITVNYMYSEHLVWNGTTDPAFVLSVVSLDNLNPEANDRYSKIFFEYFRKTLGTPDNRGYITFIDPGRAYIGHTSTTFATIFGSK